MAEERNHHERERRRREHGFEQKVAIDVQGVGAVGEDERGEDLEGRLFAHPAQCGQRVLARVSSKDFRNGRTLDAACRG